jgi:glucose-6-phosphate 1-dehydrogenase
MPLNPLRGGLSTDLPPDRGVLVIFGATGDLSALKLLPGVYNLARDRALPAAFWLVGTGRRVLTDEAFRSQMEAAVRKRSRSQPIDATVWGELAARMSFVRTDPDVPETFRQLGARLDVAGPAPRTFYLAVPPTAVAPIVRQLRAAGLCDPPQTRVVVEKPFGTDLASAVALNRALLADLEERQIFRIDHYLGKETVQNLLVLRFGNTIFEPLWSRNYVSHVEITAAEHIGIGGRGRFYEETGLLRDVLQNHAMQLLSLMAMEAPVAWDADAVREEKVKVLRALRPIVGAEAIRRCTVRGQYRAGVVRGEPVVGYREESDVGPASSVETFGALRVCVDNWRWGGVPFYLRAGKRLAKRVTEIVLHFKPVPHRLFEASSGTSSAPNALVVRIQPNEGMALRFATKVPGQAFALRDVTMDFSYGTAFGDSGPEAYERLLIDAMRGDATLFTRADEAEAQWRFIDPIRAAWHEDPASLHGYDSGSWGPVEADALPGADGLAWSIP